MSKKEAFLAALISGIVGGLSALIVRELVIHFLT